MEMSSPPAASAPPAGSDRGADTSTILWDGLMAGAIGALVVALWFLVRDIAAGHPLHTPGLLATALLEGPSAAAGGVEFRAGPVAIYSLIHLAAFSAFGAGVVLAARKLSGAVRTAALLAAFVLLEGGAYGVAAAVWPPVAADLPLWSVLAANLLAAAAIGYFLSLRTGRLL